MFNRKKLAILKSQIEKKDRMIDRYDKAVTEIVSYEGVYVRCGPYSALYSLEDYNERRQKERDASLERERIKKVVESILEEKQTKQPPTSMLEEPVDLTDLLGSKTKEKT